MKKQTLSPLDIEHKDNSDQKKIFEDLKKSIDGAYKVSALPIKDKYEAFTGEYLFNATKGGKVVFSGTSKQCQTWLSINKKNVSK